MMRLSYYILRSFFSCLRHHKSFSTSDVYKSFKCYFEARSNDNLSTKGLFRVLHELSILSNYWKCFPDTYCRFSMYLKDFTNREQMLSFIPQGAYSRFSESVDNRYNLLLDDKILCHNILKFYHIPCSEMLFYCINGIFYHDGILLNDSQIEEILNSVNENRIFVKKYTGGAGSGVSIFTKGNAHFYSSTGDVVTSGYIKKLCMHGKWLFEKQIMQDNVLNEFNSDTVNTCRVMTFENKVVAASVRMGRKGSFVDNAAKGGIVVSLDVDTGKLGEYGLREYDPIKYYEHPDSHIQFKDTFIPQWFDVKHLVEQTLSCLPYYRSVGFDVATTTTGPKIIEINTGTGVYANQMGKDWGIADKFLI